MKKLMMVFGMIFASPSSFAGGAITLQNKTDFSAQFIVRDGDKVIALIPEIVPGQIARIPTGDVGNFSVVAVVNGVTTEIVSFKNASAVVDAIESYYYGLDAGVLELVVE